MVAGGRPLRIFVTGGARGLGAAAVAGFVAAGAQVAFVDLREAEAAAVIGRHGADRCRFWRCDVSRKGELDAAIDAGAEWLGGLDVLIASAGLDRPATAEDLAEADWDLVMAVNAKGTMLSNQAALRHMRSSGGRIVNFTSIYGVRGGADRAAYSAAKAAVIGWTRAAARDWGRFNIAVNAIAPIMATEQAERYIARLPEAEQIGMAENLAREIPLGGRLGDPARELVPLLLFLAGPGAAYMTGQTIGVDGGMMIG